jgi:hypothetical protein
MDSLLLEAGNGGIEGNYWIFGLWIYGFFMSFCGIYIGLYTFFNALFF